MLQVGEPSECTFCRCLSPSYPANSSSLSRSLSVCLSLSLSLSLSVSLSCDHSHVESICVGTKDEVVFMCSHALEPARLLPGTLLISALPLSRSQ